MNCPPVASEGASEAHISCCTRWFTNASSSSITPAGDPPRPVLSDVGSDLIFEPLLNSSIVRELNFAAAFSHSGRLSYAVLIRSMICTAWSMFLDAITNSLFSWKFARQKKYSATTVVLWLRIPFV